MVRKRRKNSAFVELARRIGLISIFLCFLGGNSAATFSVFTQDQRYIIAQININQTKSFMKFNHIFSLAMVVLLFCVGKTSAQNAPSLYMPLNIKDCYEKGTRSDDGKPGAAYWQNKANYLIDVSVDIPNKTVNGSVSITYTNNSPDTLKTIRLKMAHDLWKKGNPRNYPLPVQDIGDGMVVSNVQIDGSSKFQRAPIQSSTFLNLFPKQALAPGGQMEISMDWSYVAPSSPGTPRECVCDSTTWFLAYWYPQVAVYDDLHGWASVPYNGMQEMYNDFSDYEVNITVPADIMVWSTGEWANPGEVLKPKFLSRFKEAQRSKEVVSIFSKEDYERGKPFFKKSSGTHTYVYKAQNVPDFAFALSNYYLWDAHTITVDANTGRKALVAAAYNPASEDYYEVCEIAGKGIKLMSEWLPGYPYPYPAMTVFNGDDGMEFPMMCNDVSTAPRSPIGLTVHESSHTYFPFMMGINEQYYAWMDEGWAAFFDVLVTDSVAGKPQGSLRNYPDYAGTDGDMPPMVPSCQLGTAYRVASYNRPQAAYMNLYQMLGYETFHKCMVEYMDRWKGKHPQPFDFFNTWNEVSGQNLNWFWKPWFFDWGYPDLAVEGLQSTGRGEEVIIKNSGTMPMSVFGTIEFEDGSTQNIRLTSEVWKSGNQTVKVQIPADKKVVKVQIGDPHVSDKFESNNIWMRG